MDAFYVLTYYWAATSPAYVIRKRAELANSCSAARRAVLETKPSVISQRARSRAPARCGARVPSGPPQSAAGSGGGTHSAGSDLLEAPRHTLRGSCTEETTRHRSADMHPGMRLRTPPMNPPWRPVAPPEACYPRPRCDPSSQPLSACVSAACVNAARACVCVGCVNGASAACASAGCSTDKHSCEGSRSLGRCNCLGRSGWHRTPVDGRRWCGCCV